MRIWIGALILLAAMAVPVFADDAVITTDFADFETVKEFIHEEADPFKGWAIVTVTNTGSEPWGDFHFEITGVGIENVDFIVDAPYQPYAVPAMPSLQWTVDNNAVGATLDLEFYSDPVDPGETVTFHAYTDNTTDQNPFFGLCMYPTPLPEPATLAMLGLGLAIVIRRR